MHSRAVVAMVVVDTKPVILPNLHNDHMTNLKRQLRKVWQLRPSLTSFSLYHPPNPYPHPHPHPKPTKLACPA